MPSSPLRTPGQETSSTSARAGALARVRGWLLGTSATRGRAPEAAPDRSSALLDAVPDAFLLVDAEDRVLAANAAVAAFLGHAPETLVGAGLAETLFAPQIRDAHRARLRQSAEAGRDGRLGPGGPVPVLRADGTEIVADLTVQRIPQGGKPVFGVCLRPAPAPAAADASLVAARDAAEDRQRILRTIVDAIPDPVVAMDRGGRIVLQNRASLRLSGSTADAEAAPPVADPSHPAQQWAPAEAVLRSGEAVHDQDETDPAGSTWRTTRIPVRNRAGEVLGLVAISHDVTAQKATEAQLLADKQSAEAASRANNDYLATTSHEIRTLMNGVSGMTNLLLDTDLDEEQRDFVHTVRSSGDALLTIINDILDFSKIEAGMLALEERPFNVRQALKDALSLVAPQGAAKGLAVSADVADDVPEAVFGDATRIQQVLVNLLSNALKFTDTGSVRVHVALAEAGAQPVLAVSVADTGVGIAPERLEAIFERFAQADASTARTHGGTGLGLSICRRLVEMMGGALSAESVPGGGSVFRFTVAVRGYANPWAEGAETLSAADVWIARPAATPAAPAPAGDAPADAPALPRVDLPSLLEAWDVPSPAMEPAADPAADPALDLATAPANEFLTDVAMPPATDVATPPAAPEAPAAPPPAGPAGTTGTVMSMDAILPAARVLLAEDNPVNQKVTTLTLRRLGYRADVVADGASAVEAVRRQPYDVVLMDVMMPVMDGLEATRQIRAQPGRHPEPAIVALTANAMQGDRQKCLDAGCDDYLAKPVAPRLLAATIERAVRTRSESPVTAAD